MKKKKEFWYPLFKILQYCETKRKDHSYLPPLLLNGLPSFSMSGRKLFQNWQDGKFFFRFLSSASFSFFILHHELVLLKSPVSSGFVPYFHFKPRQDGNFSVFILHLYFQFPSSSNVPCLQFKPWDLFT